jgi:hypothetical protein
MTAIRSFVRGAVGLVLSLALVVSVAPRVAAATTYSPQAVRDALLNQAMLSSEELFGGEIGRQVNPPNPQLSTAVDGVLIFSPYGAVAFDIYATDEQALAGARLDLLDPSRDDEDPSLTYYILWGTGDANTPAGASVVVGNVAVTGIATPQDAYDAGLSGDVGGAAALASNFAKSGVYFLRRVGSGGNANTLPAQQEQAQRLPQSPPTSGNAVAGPTTALVPAIESTAVQVSQVSMALPEMVVPGGLQLESGGGYRLDRAEPVDLASSNTNTPRAVGQYSASQVAWILDHPDFMKGDPYRQIQALLTEPASAFFSIFDDPAAVADQLSRLGWQQGFLRIYALDAPPSGAAGWVEASAHRFTSVEDAQQATRYLADQFATSSGFASSSLSTTADSTFSYSGPGYNGNETAAFAQRANFVIVVIGVAPSGSPDATVRAVIDSAIAALDA